MEVTGDDGEVVKSVVTKGNVWTITDEDCLTVFDMQEMKSVASENLENMYPDLIGRDHGGAYVFFSADKSINFFGYSGGKITKQSVTGMGLPKSSVCTAASRNMYFVSPDKIDVVYAHDNIIRTIPFNLDFRVTEASSPDVSDNELTLAWLGVIGDHAYLAIYDVVQSSLTYSNYKMTDAHIGRLSTVSILDNNKIIVCTSERFCIFDFAGNLLQQQLLPFIHTNLPDVCFGHVVVISCDHQQLVVDTSSHPATVTRSFVERFVGVDPVTNQQVTYADEMDGICVDYYQPLKEMRLQAQASRDEVLSQTN